MDRQPVLEGERLLLRPLREDDRSAFLAAAGDPLIWEQHPDPARWMQPECNCWFGGALAMGGAMAVIERATGTLIGSSRFLLPEGVPDTVEIGSTFLVRAHWGDGTNFELKRLMVVHALAALPRVRFLIGERNWRSRRAMEKIGGLLTDEIVVAELVTGPVEHVVYEITRNSLANGPLAA